MNDTKHGGWGGDYVVAMVTEPFHLNSLGITKDLLQVWSQLILKRTRKRLD
jgi:hypothetical protein